MLSNLSIMNPLDKNIVEFGIYALFGASLYASYVLYKTDLDLVQQINKLGGKCYLTGDYLYLQIKQFFDIDTNNFGYITNYDIVVKNIEMSVLQKILKKYDDVKYYDYDLDTNNYRRCTVKLEYYKYELTLVNDRKYTFNSVECEINSLSNLLLSDEQIKELITKENYKQMYDIKYNLLRLNDNHFIEDIYDVLRVFKYACRYKMTINSTYKELLKECCEDIKIYNTKINYEILLFELLNIFTVCNMDYFEIMIEIGLFEAIDFEFTNKNDLIYNFTIFKNEIDFRKFVWLLANLTDESFNKIDLIIENELKRMIWFSRDYDKNKVNIIDKNDLLKYLTNYNKKNNYLTSEYKYMYYSNIKYLDDIMYLPISTHQVNFDGIILKTLKNLNDNEINKNKKELLDLIHQDKIQNNEVSIYRYLNEQISV